MRERRRVQRTRVLKSAKIILNHQASIYDCSARDLSNLGACLQLSSTLGIPDSFDLTFDAARSSRPCRVVWRTKDRLGVSFERSS